MSIVSKLAVCAAVREGYVFQNVKIRDGHDNFFTPLRLLFAVMVVIGHAFVVASGDPLGEPRLFFDYRPSFLAVNLFFIASGFLVTKSMLYRGDIAEYSSSRILRIMPALAVHVLFVMFIVGPFVTNLPLREFFTDPQFLTQPLQVLSFYETNMVMPGAFASNAENYGSAALWTLRYEMLAYIGTALAFSLGLMRKRWMILAQFTVMAMLLILAKSSGVYDTLPATLSNLLRFGVCYGLGAAIYAYKDRLSFNIIGLPILGVLAALSYNQPFFDVITTIWVGYFVFWAAYIKAPRLNWTKSLEDTSYGIYIYHWVILQWVAYAYPNAGHWTLLAVALPVSLVLGLLSWRFVEKPILKKKAALTKFFRRKGVQKTNSGPVILQD